MTFVFLVDKDSLLTWKIKAFPFRLDVWIYSYTTKILRISKNPILTSISNLNLQRSEVQGPREGL